MSKPKIHVFDRWLTGLSDYRAVCGVRVVMDSSKPVPTRDDLLNADCLHCLTWIAESEGRRAEMAARNAVNATSRAKSVRLRSARRRAR